MIVALKMIWERVKKRVPAIAEDLRRSTLRKSPELASDLSREALAPHQGFSIGDIRKYAFSLRFGGPRDSELGAHLKSCDICNSRLLLLNSTDPVFTSTAAEDGFQVVIGDKKKETEELVAATAAGSQ